jgi:sugar lactone lactonase YvrE
MTTPVQTDPAMRHPTRRADWARGLHPTGQTPAGIRWRGATALATERVRLRKSGAMPAATAAFQRLATALTCLLLLAGCSRIHPAPPAAQQISALVWPSPPDPPRIAYVQSISSAADLGITLSALTRFGHWLTGSNKGNEPLLKPFGIALDENDNLCLTDTGSPAVCFYDRTKHKGQRWDRISGRPFISPVAIARRGGVFYVADSGWGAVLAFRENGKLLLQITNHLERPSGLAVINDQLFVADSQRHCVVVFGLDGAYRSEFGRRGDGPAQFNFPTHLAADAAGGLYVTDSLNGRVQAFDSQGRYQRQIGSLGDGPGCFSRPKGVALDPVGHLHVVDAVFDNFQVFDLSGRLLLVVGEAGSHAGQFWLPNGIAISRSNEVFVADSYNHRVQIFKYVGQP